MENTSWISLRPSKSIGAIIVAKSSSHVTRLVFVFVNLIYHISSLVVPQQSLCEIISIFSAGLKKGPRTQEGLVHAGLLSELCAAERTRFGRQSGKDPGFNTDESEGQLEMLMKVGISYQSVNRWLSLHTA